MFQQSFKLDPSEFKVIVLAMFVTRRPAELSHADEKRVYYDYYYYYYYYYYY